MKRKTFGPLTNIEIFLCIALATSSLLMSLSAVTTGYLSLASSGLWRDVSVWDRVLCHYYFFCVCILFFGRFHRKIRKCYVTSDINQFECFGCSMIVCKFFIKLKKKNQLLIRFLVVFRISDIHGLSKQYSSTDYFFKTFFFLSSHMEIS